MKKIFLILTIILSWSNFSLAESFFYPNGDEYIGKLVDGKREGKGTLIYWNFKKYEGEFKNDKRHGEGTFTDEADGILYIGQWKDDKKSGSGAIRYKNGLKYSGEWKNDKENGKGKIILPTGEEYVGQFKDGVAFFEGEQPIVYDNSELFYGKYKNNKKHGQGTLVFADVKAKFSAVWENGKLVSIQEQSDNKKLLLQKGHVLNRNGYLNGAILYYKKTLEVDPTYKPAKLSLESALSDLNVKNTLDKLDPVCQKSDNEFGTIKSCLSKHFFYQKHPVHPEIIKDFIPGYADSGDIIITINLSDAFDSNQYSLLDDYEISRLDEGKPVVSINYPNGEGYFLYFYYGTTDNGAMVLKTQSNSGGSGIFSDLLVLKVKKRLGADHDLFNSKGITLDKQQVVLEKLVSISLGDRQKASIKIMGNKILVNDKTLNIPNY